MMRTYLAISASWFLICFFISSMFLISFKNRKRYRRSALGCAVVAFLFSLAFFFAVHAKDHGDEIPDALRFIVSWYFSGPFEIIIPAALIHIGILYARKNKRVNETAIYDGINTLKSGFCCYKKNGLPLMVNEKMDELSYLATGEYLYSGIHFRNFLAEHMNSMDEIEIHGSYYLVTFRTVSIEKNEVYEILLTDISSEHSLNEKLQEETKNRYEYQQKLKAYSAAMKDLIRSEEILSAKVKVHAEFGNLLLLGKYSLSHKEEREHFLKEARNISALAITREDDADSLDELVRTASGIGISLHVLCEIKNEHREAVLRLLHESVTNCSKHADGKNIYLESIVASDGIRYYVYNDGASPDGEIHEGGGLGAVRTAAEKAGGRMSYQYENGFKIILEFGKGGK